jgi:hypothetical protein
MLNSDMPPMLARRLSGRKMTLMSVRFLSSVFMLLLTRLPRASIRPANTVE